jgi:hypothetical protein
MSSELAARGTRTDPDKNANPQGRGNVLVFVVTVKDQSVRRDGNVYGQLLQRCLNSMTSQTDRRFAIVLVGGDLPPGMTLPANQCQFEKLNIAPPDSCREAMNRDKTRKLIAGTEIGQAFAPDYFMFVDSDDCVHKDVVKFVHDMPLQSGGWYVKQGFVYKEGSRWAWLNRNTFHQVCGSSIIVRPDKVVSLFSEFIENDIPFYGLKSSALSCNTQLTPLPFPAILYSIANGENIHMTQGKVSRLRQQENAIKFYFRKMLKYVPVYVSKKFRDVYCLATIQ